MEKPPCPGKRLITGNYYTGASQPYQIHQIPCVKNYRFVLIFWMEGMCQRRYFLLLQKRMFRINERRTWNSLTLRRTLTKVRDRIERLYDSSLWNDRGSSRFVCGLSTSSECSCRTCTRCTEMTRRKFRSKNSWLLVKRTPERSTSWTNLNTIRTEPTYSLELEFHRSEVFYCWDSNVFYFWEVDFLVKNTPNTFGHLATDTCAIWGGRKYQPSSNTRIDGIFCCEYARDFVHYYYCYCTIWTIK